MATLKGKVIAITGAASGIGLATAKMCAARGASLALSDLNIDTLNNGVSDLKSQYPDLDVIGSKIDVTSSSSVDQWVTSAVQYFGRIDGACNIAGVEGVPGKSPSQTITDMTDEHWQFMVDVNLTGTFYCVRAELRVMKQGGSIVNMASTAGLRAASKYAGYVASKHGVVGLTKTAAKDAGSLGVRVNAVCPGPIDTSLLRRMCEGNADYDWDKITAMSPMKRLGALDEVARMFCFLLSDESTWTSGATITVDGAATA